MVQPTHGLTRQKDTRKCYEAWLDIKRKCYNPSSKEFCRYGAKGRKLEACWLNDPVAFVNYVLSLPNFSQEMTLDRVDNTQGYEEGNLRWTSSKQQARNRSMYKINTSGFQGVKFRKVRKATFATAIWHDLVTGKAKSKTFAVNRYGLLPAFAMACSYREKMIAELNKQGAGYTPWHGK